jgi:hypothetical protein
MEELVLTDPVTETKTTDKFRVISILLDLEMQSMPGEPGTVAIVCRDNNDAIYSHRYTGTTAINMIKQLNTANLTIKSLHKRVLEKLSADGILPGTVTGEPDPVALETGD